MTVDRFGNPHAPNLPYGAEDKIRAEGQSAWRKGTGGSCPEGTGFAFRRELPNWTESFEKKAYSF